VRLLPGKLKIRPSLLSNLTIIYFQQILTAIHFDMQRYLFNNVNYSRLKILRILNLAILKHKITTGKKKSANGNAISSSA